ncbi:low affinity immunoglobulin epsilon Fc receptor-like [Haliotis asinina]|uniref:low affinity immunoglobulin epsilon Fc receptor-like n=1 Tax=Haliotis asinina TaxID=109174 RepID=UPI0035324962
MKGCMFQAVAAVIYLVMIVKLQATEHIENNTDTCLLKLKENAERVRSEVINELKAEMKEEFKDEFKQLEILKKELLLERARQRVMEEKVDVSYVGVQKLEAALSQCAMIATVPITAANTTTTTTTTTTTEKPKVCAAGFVKFEDHCYLLELDKTTWGTARSRCRGLGADLVSINTEAENEFLLEKIKEYFPPNSENSEYFWMGLLYAGSKYMWADGTDVGFTDFPSGEPNCMEDGRCKAFISTFRSAYEWEDARSTYDFFYICEKDMS